MVELYWNNLKYQLIGFKVVKKSIFMLYNFYKEYYRKIRGVVRLKIQKCVDGCVIGSDMNDHHFFMVMNV